MASRRWKRPSRQRVQRPQGDVATCVVRTRCTRDQHYWWDDAAQRSGLTLSAWICSVLDRESGLAVQRERESAEE
jgi:hypothetical protein